LSNLLEVYTTDSSYSNHFFFGQGTYLNPGNYIIQSTVTGASGQTATARLYLQVISVIPPNQIPVITSTPQTSVNSSQLYSYQVTATDADGDALAYSLTQAPTWLSMNPAGFVSGVAPNVTTDYQFLITVQVSDGKSFVTQTFPLIVRYANTSNPVNSPPTITSTPVTQVNESTLYNYQVIAVDPDGDSLTYALTANPTWLSINPSTGLISGTAPNVTQDTNYAVGLSVSDSVNAPVTQSYVLTVSNVPVIIPHGNNTAPVITVISPVNGQTYNSSNVLLSITTNENVSTAWFVLDGNNSTSIQLVQNSATNFTGSVSLSDGNHNIIFYATDTNGNTGVSNVINFTVNTTIITPPNGNSGTAGGAGTRTGTVAAPDLSFENQQYLNQFAPKTAVAEESPAAQSTGISLFWIIVIILGIILIALLIFLLIRWLGWGMNLFWIIIGILVIALLILLIFF